MQSEILWIMHYAFINNKRVLSASYICFELIGLHFAKSYTSSQNNVQYIVYNKLTFQHLFTVILYLLTLTNVFSTNTSTAFILVHVQLSII